MSLECNQRNGRVLLNHSKFAFLLLTIGMLVGGAKPHQTSEISPPKQPAIGPGGANYQCGSVRQETAGQGAQGCTIFLPESPTPSCAPVIVFLHGWNAISPRGYSGWIDHLVRHQGAIVLYPSYQDSSRTLPTRFLPNAISGIKDAMQLLRTQRLGIRPDEGKIAYVGHSMGGVLAGNLAAVAKSENLPPARAVFCVEPGRTWGNPLLRRLAIDLSTIPTGTLLLTLSGDQDRLVGDTDALRIYQGATQIPPTDKDYIILQSDNHGIPALVADHSLATSVKELRRSVGVSDNNQDRLTNALDFFGTWKLFDGLCDAAFVGTNRQFALGNTPEQCHMGFWSDGTPVKPLLVSDPK